MMVSQADIEELLIAEDIEGLIAMGAPESEYSIEAQAIASALKSLPIEQLTEANVVATVAAIWANYFSLFKEDIEKRMNAFQRLAVSLLKSGYTL